MSPLKIAQWMAATPWSIALHESVYMYPVVESIHVLTLCLFVGMSVIWDLRLLGVLLPRVAVSEVTGRILPWMKLGFVLMVLSGMALFYAIPVRSYQNIFFRVKMLLLVLAGVNAWLFHVTVHRRAVEWDLDATPPRGARIAGAASLLLWASIIVAGRMIAYNWLDCDRNVSPLVSTLAGCTNDSR
jgi:hypothetical protein